MGLFIILSNAICVFGTQTGAGSDGRLWHASGFPQGLPYIAGVADQQQINQLFGQVNQPTEAAKVIDMMALNAQAELRSNAI